MAAMAAGAPAAPVPQPRQLQTAGTSLPFGPACMPYRNNRQGKVTGLMGPAKPVNHLPASGSNPTETFQLHSTGVGGDTSTCASTASSLGCPVTAAGVDVMPAAAAPADPPLPPPTLTHPAQQTGAEAGQQAANTQYLGEADHRARPPARRPVRAGTAEVAAMTGQEPGAGQACPKSQRQCGSDAKQREASPIRNDPLAARNYVQDSSTINLEDGL